MSIETGHAVTRKKRGTICHQRFFQGRRRTRIVNATEWSLMFGIHRIGDQMFRGIKQLTKGDA